MLKVFVHTGPYKTRSLANQIAALDISYARKDALSDYLVALSLAGSGEIPPNMVRNYPRWSGSLWDLVARALTRVLYNDDLPPPSPEPDKRCAYATELTVVIEQATLGASGVELARGNIVRDGVRGHYKCTLTEDISGTHAGTFSYGQKRMSYPDLLLRAISHALFKTDQLGPVPALAIPATLNIDGVLHFHVEGLKEPARTGFLRFIGAKSPTAVPLAKADDYARFLVKG